MEVVGVVEVGLISPGSMLSSARAQPVQALKGLIVNEFIQVFICNVAATEVACLGGILKAIIAI